MRPCLLQALRIVIRSDSDPARQVLFSNLMESHPSVRLAFRIHEWLRGTSASAFFVSCYGLASYFAIGPPRHRGARVVIVAKHANARRQVARTAAWVGEDACGWVRTGRAALWHGSTLTAARALLSPRRLRRAFRLVRTIDERHGFLVSCRAAGAIAWYARMTSMLRELQPGAVLVSGDSHPEDVGVAAAARALDIPQIFIAHAYPTPFSPPLRFTLSILEGEGAVRARREKGPIVGAVLLAGVEGHSTLMDPTRFTRPRPVIGIFPPKAISWRTFAAIVEDCRTHFHASKILIRWHPSMLEPPHLSRHLADVSGIVESPRAATLEEVARDCDWVVADENSNVHLPVLKLGMPTVAVKALGLYPPSRVDLYGFAAHGVLFPPVHSIRDVQPEALAAFFADCWRSRFEEYDASYMRSPEVVGAEVRRAVWQLLERHHAMAAGA